MWANYASGLVAYTISGYPHNKRKKQKLSQSNTTLLSYALFYTPCYSQIRKGFTMAKGHIVMFINGHYIKKLGERCYIVYKVNKANVEKRLFVDSFPTFRGARHFIVNGKR